MKALVLVAAAALAVSACDSAPSEESPVAPAVICEEGAENASCPVFDEVITNEHLLDGNVQIEYEGVPVLESEVDAPPTNAS